MTKKHWTERGYQALPMAMVAVNGVDLSYAEYGRGKEQVMIMTHFYHETFEGLLEALADRFHIYALTARTTGKVKATSDGGHDWTGQWAEDTVNFARHMGVNKFIFAGQSHGGSVGWRILYEHPEMLSALASLAGVAPIIETDPEVLQRGTAFFKRITSLEKGHFRIGEAYMRDIPRIREATERAWGAVDKTGLARWTRKTFDPDKLPDTESIRAWLQTVRTPILCIVAARDHNFLITGESGERNWIWTARNVPNVKVVSFQNEGHYMFSENPEVMADEIKLFVDQMSS